MMEKQENVSSGDETIDETVGRILAEDEAGVGAAMAVLELAESHYFPAAAAVAPDPPVVTGSTTSSS